MNDQYVFTYKGINDRKRKNLSILEMIRQKGNISRTDIAKETGVNIVSISNSLFVVRCMVGRFFNLRLWMHLFKLTPFHPPVKTGGYSYSTPSEFYFKL